MPTKVQTWLDLPVRKTRSGVATSGIKTGGVVPTRKLLLSPMDDQEKHMRTAMRKKVVKKEDDDDQEVSCTTKADDPEVYLEEACKVLPSNQKKVEKSTKKENVAKNIFTSPSAALSKLALNSPANRNPLSIKKLYNNLSPAKVNLAKNGPLFSPNNLSYENTPCDLLLSHVKTQSLHSPEVNPPASIQTSPTKALFQSDVSRYQQARQALNTSAPSTLLCREAQVSLMNSWLDSHLVSKKPGSLYVSGAPGTGKTATLTHLLMTKKANYKEIFINCMVLKSSIAIYREVAKQLNPKATFKTERDALKVIQVAVTSPGEMILLVLDEVDQLDSKNQNILYTVFEWPVLSSSRLALVGIANALDLTDRVLPRLQVKEVYKPMLLHYPPYTKQQIAEIINARLQSASDGGPPVITSRAVTFLSGKISSLSGDLRKALDVCRRALEMAETKARKQTLLNPMSGRILTNGSETSKNQLQLGTVDVKEIMKVINQVYGSQLAASLGAGSSNNALPLQQKLLMASLLLMVKKGTTKDVTLGKLTETYTNVCKKRKMGALDQSACVGMCDMLESRGIVTFKRKIGMNARLAKVSLRLDEDEVAQAMQDKTMLASIIEDITCLAK